MFIVYKSNKLNILLSKVYQIIEKKPLSSIFKKEIFIHENKILFQYINIFIANKTGISANFKLYHPNNFIWKLFQKISDQKEVKNQFTQSILTWKIMKIIDEKNICQYIKKTDNTIKKFKFSFLMASIFEQYLLYRPNWINTWEKEDNSFILDESEKWQIKLWKEIIHNTNQNNKSNNHYSNLFYDMQFLIKNQIAKIKDFPDRLFFITSHKLNPFNIQFFKIISKYINVYFLHVTPYKKNILFENNEKNLKNQTYKQKLLNNSIIELWGQYEKMHAFYIVASKKIKIINYFKKNINSNLLNSIQNDFIEYNLSKIQKTKKRYICKTDNSISIHICYNKKNEIEILYEKLLDFFYSNQDITPNDIVVTSYKIKSYIPYINLIFASVHNKKQIPFFISKTFSKKTEIILSAFNKILNLSNSRCTNEEILQLLDIPEISNNFNISEKEVNILYNWIKEANIRWALDHNHKDRLFFPKNNENSWMYGIEKLLLSYAMNDTENVWNNILACSVINGSRSELIGKLFAFINTLQKWQKKLSKKQSLKYWHSLSEKIINDFFYKNTAIEKSIKIIQKNWIEMINDGLLSNYSKKISIDILKKNFFCKNNYNRHVFLPGVVNFCHPEAICYIPFKIICIIGADHSSIPKKNLDIFNLLNKYPLIGDTDSYQKYSYLFLQSISCSKQYFYISYIGHSTKDNSKIYPSILIDQLLNYIALNFCFIGDQNLNIQDNIRKIKNHLCKKYKEQYFYIKKKINCSITKNIQNTFKKIDYQNKDNFNYFKKINLKDLIFFWKNPIRYFFNFNLKIKLNSIKQENYITEPFFVEKLDSFKIKNILLNKIIQNQDTTKLLKYYILSGRLPYNFFGKIFWNQKIKEMQSIAQLVNKYRFLTQEKKISLKLKKYHINGILSEIQETGLLRWKPNIINYSDRIALWIEHLVYCASGSFKESKIIGCKNQVWSFSALHSDIASDYLFQYISGYIQGIKDPLLLTRSGACWLDQVYSIKDNFITNDRNIKRTAHKKMFETWTGNNYFQGEKKDLYIQKIITKLSEENIKKICDIAQKWLIPMLKNTII